MQIRLKIQRLSSKMWRILGGLSLGALLWAGYLLTAPPLDVVINNQPLRLRLHRWTVAAAVAALNVTLVAEDIVQPPLDTRLSSGDAITVQLAQPVIIEADGRSSERLTQQQTVAGVLAEAGVTLNPDDAILINSQSAATYQARLPRGLAESTTFHKQASLLAAAPPINTPVTRPKPIRLIVRRAIPVTLNDGRLKNAFYTTQPNVGEALLEQGVPLFLEDKVTPGLGTRLTPGMRIFIDRSIPVTIEVDGRTLQTRTRQSTVGEVLTQEGIALMGQDFSHPTADQPVSANDSITVVRVRENVEIEQEFIDFETEWIADETMELDKQEIRQAGATGVIKTRSRVRYENGQQVWREVEDKWLDQAPQDRVIVYGTEIVVRTLETEDGPIDYWRKISMLTTAYNAVNSGKSADHPRYGITRSGLPAGYGVAAVDASVIPLMTDLYIPGYGRAVAGDTGGRILGKHIDLGFDDDHPLPIIYEWRDVYILTPVPSANQIRYVLPQWPQR